MVYVVYMTEKFDKEMKKFSEEEQKRIKKIFFQIRDNPYVGNQLRYKFLREKRLQEKRIYYLVYDDLQAVLIVAISNKKTQQETINHIVQYFDGYRIYLEQILKKS